MATNYEKKFAAQTNSTFAFSFDAANKAPIIAKRIFNTLSDAQAYANNVNDNAVEGLLLTVVSDGANNGAYFVESIGNAEGGTASLVKLSKSAESSSLSERLDDLEDASVSGENAIVVDNSSAKDAKTISLKIKAAEEGKDNISLSQDGSGLTASLQWGTF